MNKQTSPDALPAAFTQMEAGAENPFSTCHELADVVADLMQHVDARGANCLRFIASAFDNTPCSTVKLAIENCFLYHLGTRIFTGNDHSRLLKLLPRSLHHVLMRQMLATGP